MRLPTLSFERSGQGEPLVLLHGLGATHRDFAPVAEELAREFDVLAIDLPGHGRSPRGDGSLTVAAITDAVERDLDAHGITRAHLLGNSLGARVCLELARRGRALSVVALAPSGLASAPERLYQALVMARARVTFRLLRPWLEQVGSSIGARTVLFARMRARPWKTGGAEVEAVRDGFGSATGFWSTLLHAVLCDLPIGLDEVTVPVVLVEGLWDRIAPGQAFRYAALVRHARLEILPSAGHIPQSDVPHEILRLAKETARRASPSVAPGPRATSTPAARPAPLAPVALGA